MDGDRFDKLSRSIAERSTRRQALLRFGGGGVAASLFGLLGVREVEAQDTQTKTCRLQLTAHWATGPDKGQDDLDGDLTLKIGTTDGAIAGGSFKTKSGTTYDVVGQATGRALSMVFTGGDQEVITLMGVAQRDVILCRGDL